MDESFKKTDILPDSRAKRPTDVQAGTLGRLCWMNWVPIFCANCGCEGGRVPEENMTFTFWLCNDCWEKHGEIAGTLAVPDEVFWEEVRKEKQRRT